VFHTFDTEVAELFNDTNIATLFQNLCYWIIHNKTNKKNMKSIEINGKEVERYFTFNSISAFTKQFSYFSKKQIENYLNKLKEKKLIVKASFNEKGFDRTSWYCLVDEDYWMKKYLGSKPEGKDKDKSEKTLGDKPEAKDEDKPEEMVEETPEETPEDTVSSHFPKRRNGFPQTEKWTSPNGEMDFPNRGDGFPQTGRPIPDINSYPKPNYKPNTAASVRTYLQSVDPIMIFDYEFYRAAADFLNTYKLEEDYLQWFYQQIKSSKRISNVSGYFFKVFFRSVYVERYNAQQLERKKSGERKQETEIMYECPVCGESQTVSTSSRSCTCCDTPINPNSVETERFSRLFKMDAPTKESYIFARTKVLISGGNVSDNLKALDKQFGIVS